MQTVDGSLVGAFGRALGVLYAVLAPVWAAMLLFGAPRTAGQIPEAYWLIVIVGLALLMALLAWLGVAMMISPSVTVSDVGIVVDKWTLRPRAHDRLSISWSSLRGPVIYSRFAGTVAVSVDGPPFAITLTLRQARAVLCHPRNTVTVLPPSLLRRFAGL